mmetsp:Transcript_32556/g.59500  ORF Transcript_32556/g.59500 Transcript_32556/m.59500 type:complete len:104 (+) Transcript_32556:213-524(+)
MCASSILAGQASVASQASPCVKAGPRARGVLEEPLIKVLECRILLRQPALQQEVPIVTLPSYNPKLSFLSGAAAAGVAMALVSRQQQRQQRRPAGARQVMPLA